MKGRRVLITVSEDSTLMVMVLVRGLAYRHDGKGFGMDGKDMKGGGVVNKRLKTRPRRTR